MHEYKDLVERNAMIFMENDTIGDGVFVPEMAKTLRQYADMIEARKAGHDVVETFTSAGGTRLVKVAGPYYGQCIPRLAEHSELTETE